SGMTLEAWVLPSRIGTLARAAIVKHNAGGTSLDYGLYASKSAAVPGGHVFTTSDVAAPATSPLTTGTWTHVATTYDGAVVRTYVNGVLAGSQTATGPIVTSSGVLRLGGDSLGSEWFAGTLDEVRVYNRALTQAEIQGDMSTPVVPDTTAPTVASTTPGNGDQDVDVMSSVTATFSEGMDASTVNASTVTLSSGGGGSVPATVAYDGSTGTATLTPSSPLSYGTTYTATVTTGAADASGNHLASARTWTFTTPAAAPPVLVVTSSGNGFTRYLPEILRAEGLNAFTTADIGVLTPAFLASFDVVVLGDMPVTASQVSMLTSWAQAGGNLIAMRPDKQFA